MQIQKISAYSTTFKASVSPNTETERKKYSPLQSMSKGEKIGLSMIAAGSILISAYFLIRGKIKKNETISKYYQALKQEKFKGLSKKIKKQLKNFIPHYEEAMPSSYKKLKNGNTVIIYQGENSYGDILSDRIIFDSNNKVIRRVIIHKNPHRGENKGKVLVQSYKGGSEILKDINKFPKGSCDPTYFVKCYYKESKRKTGENIYMQNIQSFDKDGNCKSTFLETNINNSPLSMVITKGKVPTFINQDKCFDFKWGYKRVQEAYNYFFIHNFNNKVKGYATQISMKDGEPFNGKVFAKVFNSSAQEYNSYDELFEKNSAFRK